MHRHGLSFWITAEKQFITMGDLGIEVRVWSLSG
jgi:hypothetical protein